MEFCIKAQDSNTPYSKTMLVKVTAEPVSGVNAWLLLTFLRLENFPDFKLPEDGL